MRLVELVMLCITFIILNLLSITLLRKKNKNIIYKMFIALLYAFAIYVLGLALQIIFYKTDISPVKFEYLSFLGMTTAPVFAFLVGLAYYKEDIIKLKRVIPLFIIPVITTLLFWIDDSLIFENYSVNLNEMRYGTWFYIYTAYTYLLCGSAIVLLIISAIRKSGFYSIQMLCNFTTRCF